MKRHIDEIPSSGMVPTKEGLYSRSNPVSPPAHLIGPSGPLSSGAPPIMSNVQSVQNILHMSNQPSNPPPSVPQPMYSKDSNMTTVQYQYTSSKASAPQPPQMHMRHKVHSSTNIAVPGPGTPPGTSSQQHFQRLKVEDALSYLDQVKFKFGNQPQVYNDFLDIMKEFKSQSIDTPGVIQRVSNLFKGHPELIVGFNTFLPPGYKIEVQSNEQGFAFQVSVSMPSPTASTTTLIQTPHHPIGGQSDTITVVPTGPVKHPPTGPLVPRATSPPPASSHYPHPAPPPTAAGLLTQSSFGMMPISQQQAHLAVTHALNNVDSNHPTPQSQPVEFNHAINYVNKIKNRFQGQPDKYKKFLEILHTYQKDQRNVKEGALPTKHLSEAEVYSQVSKLFEHQEDLLAEFGQFLPDATSHLNAKSLPGGEHLSSVKKSTTTLKTMSLPRDSSGSERDTPRSSGPKPAPPLKRSSSFSTTPKKHKMTSLRDVTIAEAGKYASLTEYAFFDKVRRALKSQDVYENFLRCLLLYNNEMISKHELLLLVTSFLNRSPDLLRWIKDFLGVSDPSGLQNRMDLIPSNTRQDRPTGDLAMEIDYSTCKRLGASYCALPKSYPLPKSSGRTALCREVLNDTWVSFPTWSEDSTFVTSRKTVFEEYIYRCEDERFELDVVIETNSATIRVLEAVQKKISRMSPEEAQKFRLDDCLGGTSPTIHLRAVSRVYGDKAADMIDGLKKSPIIAIPVVLRRLRAKEDEWREAQKGFNKIWREQNEKYYLKSLDHQGMNFKQTDIKALGSKSLYNDIESIYEERHESNDDGVADSGPHLILPYKDKTILDDAANLLIHHAKRLSGLQKEDKHKIKVILRHFLPDLFHHPRQELSDDEKDEFEEMDTDDKSNERNKITSDAKMDFEAKSEPASPTDDGNRESYSLFVTNNHWYLFFRLHQILCERLTKMYDRAEVLALEEATEKMSRKEAASIVLRLKPKVEVEVCDYYPTLLEMVKSVLDGNMENAAFEDTLREMFGIHAYMAFTLDKVVTYAVRQLQHIVCDDAPQGCMELHLQEAKRGGAGGLVHTAHQRSHLEAAYQKKLEQLLSEESCYKIYIYHKESKITIEMLDSESDDAENNAETLKWAQYREGFVESMRNNADDDEPMEKPLFLPRNVRAWKKIHAKVAAVASPDPARDDEPTEEENTDASNEMADKPHTPLTRMGEQSPSDLMIQENSECRFNLHSYKVLFVINKDNLLYKKNALSLARQRHARITKAKARKMKKWIGQWVEDNCAESDKKACNDWLLGKTADLVPNRTVIVNTNDLAKAPYEPYNRYNVHVFE